MSKAEDTLAERLRRRPAKPMGSPRVGSNPTGVVFRNWESKVSEVHPPFSFVEQAKRIVNHLAPWPNG